MNQPTAEELEVIYYEKNDRPVEGFRRIIDRYHLIDKTEPVTRQTQVGWYWVEGVSTDAYTCKFQPFYAGDHRQWYIDHKWAPMFIGTPPVQEPVSGGVTAEDIRQVMVLCCSQDDTASEALLKAFDIYPQGTVARLTGLIDKSLAHSIAWQDKCTELQAEVDRLGKALDEVMGERDSYHDWADQITDAVGDCGEHSSANQPWQNAIDRIEDLKGEIDRLKGENSDLIHSEANLEMEIDALKGEMARINDLVQPHSGGPWTDDIRLIRQ